jgi:sugar phosphate isomerase/epimerase
MVSFGVSSMFFHEYTSAEIFSFAEQAGLDTIEYWLETPHFWLRGLPVDEVIACRREHPSIASLTVHAPILDLNPCSINPDVAEVSIRYAVQSIAIAEALGARVLTVHPGRRTAKRPPGSADLARFARYIAALREVAQKNDLRIAIENMEQKINFLLCTPEQMRAVLDEEPWLFFTLDISHALAQSEEAAVRYIELCSDRLVNVHISRIDGTTLHRPLDRSPVIARILTALQDHHFKGGLILEIEDLTFDHTLSAQEKIAILARDCVFMHECMDQALVL